MKVLFDTYPTAFQNPGGGETVLRMTKAHVEKLGVQVDLFDQWRTKIAGYDVVHFFSWYTQGLWPQFKEYGLKVVVTPFSWFDWSLTERLSRSVKSAAWRILRPRQAPLEERYFAAPDLFLPNSRGEAERLAARHRISAARMALVPHGTSRAFADGDPSLFTKAYGLRDFVLCVGRFEPRKNQLGLIRALRGRLQAPIVLIGSPSVEQQQYYQRCRHEGAEGFLFINALDHDSPLLASAYAAARVVVVPSMLESPGLAGLEGGTAGANVVITGNGATREYFGECADYIDPASQASIVRGVQKALTSPRSSALRERILRDYSWEKVAEATLAAYRSLSPG